MGAIVDLQTGKIIGAKKGSLAWFHEKGHIVYNKSDKGIRNSFRQQNSLEATLIFLSTTFFIDFFKWFTSISLSIYFWYQFYEEMWCWKYAIQNYKKGREKNSPRRRNK